MVGLGRMGASLARRLLRGGHRVVVYDVNPATVAELVADGAVDLAGLVAALTCPRAIWVMVPAAITGRVIDEVGARLAAGDIVIDGGNSFYRDDQDRTGALAQQGIHLVDVGTSGGVFGLERGFCLMIGGDAGAVARLDPVFRTLAPGVQAATRSPGRSDEPGTAEHGYLHCRPRGAGRLLLDPTAAALDHSPELSEYSGMASDSGEGRWTVLSAVEEGVSAPVLSAALYARFDSRGRDGFSNQVLSATRQQFGGHAERAQEP